MTYVQEEQNERRTLTGANRQPPAVAPGTHVWLERTRLLARAVSARLVVLQAPGGWGKTTLADQLAAARGATGVWCRLREPTDEARLLATIARALRRAGAAELADLVAGQPPDDGADALLGALALREEPLAVVIDEAQELDHSAAVWVRRFVEDVHPPHLIIVAGRSVDRALTRRPGAHHVHLGQDDLRFDRIDVAALLVDAPGEVVSEVQARAEGWPAAIALAAATDDPVRALSSTDTLAELVDTVLGEDLDRIAPLGEPPLLSPEIAESIAGPGAFERLLVSGVPWRRSDQWLVLSDPVRDALAGRGRLDDETREAVAARYDLAVAISYLVEHDELDVLARVAAARPWREFAHLGTGEIAALVAVLGDARVAAHPQLLLAAARAAELRDPSMRRDWLARGLELANDPTLRHQFEAEQLREMVRAADQAALDAGADLLARMGEHELVARARTLLALGIIHAFWSSPQHLAAADAQLAAAAGLFRLLGERTWEADALNRLAVMVSFHGGRLGLAAEQQAASLALLPAESRAWAIGMTYYADILDHLGRIDEADAAARAALDVGRRLGDATTIAYAAWELAMVAAHRGDVAATRAWLAETEQHPGQWFSEVTGQEFLAFGADLLGCLGVAEDAAAYRARCAERIGHGGTEALVDVLDARLEAMYGDPVRAIELLDRLDGEPYATIRTKWVRLLFRALALSRRGERDAATRTIEQALEIVAQMQVPDLPQRHEAVLVSMLDDVWPRGGVGASESLRVNLLGGFAVVRGAAVVTPASGNPATLVKLVALRRSLTADQAIDALWPDADAATGRARLRNLLNRIRTQSGDVVVRRGDLVELGPGVSVDAHRFDELVVAALAADGTNRPGLARLALATYGGELLPEDLYEDWTAAPRERLRRRQLALIDVVAEDALERGDLDEAVRLLDRAIEAEPLERSRYIAAARALLLQGRRVAAADVLARGQAALAEVGLDMELSVGDVNVL